MKKLILGFALLTSLTAFADGPSVCEPGRSLKPENPKGVQELVRILNGIKGEEFESPLKVDMNEMLAKLHPRLASSGKDCQYRIDGYTLQMLPAIDGDMMFSLLDRLPADGRHGFGVLSGSFWQALQAAQVAGLKVAWIVKAPKVVNGVYFRDYNLIALSWHGDVATLGHELRHLKQAQLFSHRSRFQQMLIEKRAQYAYKGQCRSLFERYLGELDATTEDLSAWVDHLNTLNVRTKAMDTAAELPALHLLGVNLAYPYQVAEDVLANNDCPEDFRIAVREIWDVVQNTDPSVAVKQLRQTLAVASNLSNKSSPRFESLVGKAEALRSEIAGGLLAKQSERRTGIRETLRKLPRADRRLWCDYSGSFYLMAGCKELDAEEEN